MELRDYFRSPKRGELFHDIGFTKFFDFHKITNFRVFLHIYKSQVHTIKNQIDIVLFEPIELSQKMSVHRTDMYLGYITLPLFTTLVSQFFYILTKKTNIFVFCRIVERLFTYGQYCHCQCILQPSHQYHGCTNRLKILDREVDSKLMAL